MLVFEWWRIAARRDASEILEIFGQTPHGCGRYKTAKNDKQRPGPAMRLFAHAFLLMAKNT
jgi:hypothetical protein